MFFLEYPQEQMISAQSDFDLVFFEGNTTWGWQELRFMKRARLAAHFLIYLLIPLSKAFSISPLG